MISDDKYVAAVKRLHTESILDLGWAEHILGISPRETLTDKNIDDTVDTLTRLAGDVGCPATLAQLVRLHVRGSCV